MRTMIFDNRKQAGERLARALSEYASRSDVVVIALPRGGVPVAFEVAQALRVPLDVMIVRKLGVPGSDELAMGAIASGGVQVINEQVARDAHVSHAVIESVVERELVELHRREQIYRGHLGTLKVKGKTVLLIDDGIATGSTIRAAAEALRQLKPAEIIVAVPVAARSSCFDLGNFVDGMVVLVQPEELRAVGLWYDDFRQTSDDEVRDLLAMAHRTQSQLHAELPVTKGHGEEILHDHAR